MTWLWHTLWIKWHVARARRLERCGKTQAADVAFINAEHHLLSRLLLP